MAALLLPGCGAGGSVQADLPCDRRDLWHAIELYADRDRRYGGAVPNEVWS